MGQSAPKVWLLVIEGMRSGEMIDRELSLGLW